MLKTKPLSADEHRAKQSHLVNVSIGLECRLRNLVREILVDGNVSKLSEFQSFIHYAPDAARERIYAILDRGGPWPRG